MDERARLRQFYQRFLLVAGMLWGGMPFLTAPLINRGAIESPVAIAVAVFSSISLLLACTIGFWHRRTACIWLTFNALVIISALAITAAAGRRFDLEETIGVAGSIAIALLLDWMEFQRWPGALQKLS